MPRLSPALGVLALAACTPDTAPVEGDAPLPDPPEGVFTLAFGGDVIMGRRLNRILHDPQPQPWGSAREALREADITLVNSEGVISSGGMYYDKGDTMPYEYRAHPGAIDMLLDGGVDVAAIGNNHTMDYGPDALLEMVDLLEGAGIRAAGGGETPERAASPVYVERDGLVVAFVGMVLTTNHRVWAEPGRPGLYGARLDHDDLLPRLELALTTARERAHLVFFTPHWGPNGATAPGDDVRYLAADLIDLGYDGILGHSAHVLQGMELIDGKPVLYDAGNMLVDMAGSGTAGQAMHFVLELDATGVHTVHGMPHRLTMNAIAEPTAEEHAEILQVWTERSAALGTAVSADGVVDCEPGDGHIPLGTPAAIREVHQVRTAPSRALPDALPPEADTTIVATWPDLGVELVAAHLLAPEVTEKAAQWVTTWWRRLPDGPTPPEDLEIGLVWLGDAGRRTESHLPADWMLRASDWPEEGLVRDEQILRIEQDPGGVLDFELFLRRGPSGAELPPETASTLVNHTRIPLGSAVYGGDDVPRLLERTPLP